MIVLKNRKLFLNVRIYHTIWLVATGLLLYCVVTAINNSFGENNELIMTVVDKQQASNKQQEEILLPGQFNLVEDAVMFNGAMMRPPKECTLGKMKNKRYS